MAIDRKKLAARLSAALTLLSAAGLVTAFGLTLTTTSRGALIGASAANELPAPPAAVSAGPPKGLDLIRAKAVQVTDIVIAEDKIAEEKGEVALLAGRKRNGAASEAEAPPSTWDGTPKKEPHGIEAPGAAARSKTEEPARPLPPPAVAPGHDPKASADPKAAAAPAPAPDAPAPVKEAWSDAEIMGALKECLALMGPVAAEIEPAEPTRKGPCGAPAPIKLKSVGAAAKVDFTPALEVNCQLAVKLAHWVDHSLQPAARETLGSPVRRITGGGGYACRNRYGLAVAPLSEHALANAVDLPAFVLADGRTIKVATEWGPTRRDIEAARIAATKAASDEAGAKDTKKSLEAEGRASAGSVAGKGTARKDVVRKDAGNKDAGNKDAGNKDADKKDEKGEPDASGTAPVKSVAAPGSGTGKDKRKVAGLRGASLQKLGSGPTLASAKSNADDAAGNPKPSKPMSGGAAFLRRISGDACRTFGTVLGPEANDAHRDHFHFDLKARRKSAYCQ